MSVADTTWALVTMFVVFVLGIAMLRPVSRTIGLSFRRSVLLYFWHTFFCLIYMFYSLSFGGDSLTYYSASQVWEGAPKLGTQSVIAFTAIFTQGFNLSYGGAFLVYNIFGVIGLVGFAAALKSNLKDKSQRTQRIISIIPFLPGFSFWSSAVGKDSLTFLGSGLICWSVARPYRRIPAILIGLIAIGFVRPHVAGFLLVALSFAFILAGGRNIMTKILMSSVLLPTSFVVISIALNYVGLEDLENLNDVSRYVDQRQGYNMEGGSSVDIIGSSVPMRLFIYLFRPLFFDANGLFGLIVSIENLVLFGIIACAIYGRAKRRSSLDRFQVVFLLLFVVICWLAQSNVTANLGIAVRQKIMFTPMLILLALSFYRPRVEK